MKRIIIYIFLVLIFLINTNFSFAAITPIIHIPYFSGDVIYDQTAIFWFGKITPQENYTDVRIGYNNQELYVNLSIFDRLLWYDQNANSDNLTHGDNVTVYLTTDPNLNSTNNPNVFKFVSQLNWWEERSGFQSAYQGNASGWTYLNKPFTTTSGWRGNAPNDTTDDRGWVTTIHIPFNSLNQTTPTNIANWKIAIVVHDRDDIGETMIPDKFWPENFTHTNPSSWNLINFGLPNYTPPEIGNKQTITVRNLLNNQTVIDSSVGGDTNCGEGLDYWNKWGEKNYLNGHLVIQNQSDVADWPCFSKTYFNFPLNLIPKNKIITKATLSLYLFGNSDPTQAKPSYIQSAIVGGFNESTINWNNAPLLIENIGQSWVNPYAVGEQIIWPGKINNWDVSLAVKQAYDDDQALNLALYSADSDYHSGKYFVHSEIEDWNAVGRPTLTITYGDPTISPSPSTIPTTDINHDGKTNGVDFGMILKSFGKNNGDPLYDALADLNSDNKVDALDIFLMLRKWLEK